MVSSPSWVSQKPCNLYMWFLDWARILKACGVQFQRALYQVYRCYHVSEIAYWRSDQCTWESSLVLRASLDTTVTVLVGSHLQSFMTLTVHVHTLSDPDVAEGLICFYGLPLGQEFLPHSNNNDGARSSCDCKDPVITVYVCLFTCIMYTTRAGPVTYIFIWVRRNV